MEADATFIIIISSNIISSTSSCPYYKLSQYYYHISIIMNATRIRYLLQGNWHVCVFIKSLSSVKADLLYVIIEPRMVLSSSRARRNTWMSNIAVPILTSYLHCTTNGRTFLLVRHHRWCCRHP